MRRRMDDSVGMLNKNVHPCTWSIATWSTKKNKPKGSLIWNLIYIVKLSTHLNCQTLSLFWYIPESNWNWNRKDFNLYPNLSIIPNCICIQSHRPYYFLSITLAQQYFAATTPPERPIGRSITIMHVINKWELLMTPYNPLLCNPGLILCIYVPFHLNTFTTGLCVNHQWK